MCRGKEERKTLKTAEFLFTRQRVFDVAKTRNIASSSQSRRGAGARNRGELISKPAYDEAVVFLEMQILDLQNGREFDLLFMFFRISEKNVTRQPLISSQRAVTFLCIDYSFQIYRGLQTG